MQSLTFLKQSNTTQCLLKDKRYPIYSICLVTIYTTRHKKSVSIIGNVHTVVLTYLLVHFQIVPQDLQQTQVFLMLEVPEK